MRRKSSIGFLFGILFLCGLYCFSDQLFYERESASKEEQIVREASGGREEPVYPYYLKEQEGCIYIYQSDGETIYEKTSITMDEVPEEIRKTIREGKGVRNLEELFSFLENYSS